MKNLIVTGLLLMTASFSSLAFFKKLVVFFLTLAVSSLGTGLVLPCINSFITGSVSNEQKRICYLVYGSVRFLGVAVGPPVYSALMEWSVKGMFIATAAFALVIAVIMFGIHPGRKKRAPEKNRKHYLNVSDLHNFARLIVHLINQL